MPYLQTTTTENRLLRKANKSSLIQEIENRTQGTKSVGEELGGTY